MTEDPIIGFVSDIPLNPGYVIIEGDEGHVTNTSTTQTGSLTIKKIVQGTSTDQRFGFTVHLHGTGIPEDGPAIIGGLPFNKGYARVFLSDGETVTLTGLRVGTEYTITEDDYSEYITSSVNESGTVTAGTTMAIFTNEYYKNVAGYREPAKQDVAVRKDVLNSDAGLSYGFTAYFADLEPNTTYTLGYDI